MYVCVCVCMCVCVGVSYRVSSWALGLITIIEFLGNGFLGHAKGYALPKHALRREGKACIPLPKGTVSARLCVSFEVKVFGSCRSNAKTCFTKEG